MHRLDREHQLVVHRPVVHRAQVLVHVAGDGADAEPLGLAQEIEIGIEHRRTVLDLYAAGGIGAVLRELEPLLHLDCMTVTGETLGERLKHERGAWVDRAVVKPLKEPLAAQGGLVALFGSLAPNGAILKRSAADPALFEKEGRAVVFNSLDDLAARVDDPGLDVTPDDFMVLQNAGPKSGYAMPEAGYLPIPAPDKVYEKWTFHPISRPGDPAKNGTFRLRIETEIGIANGFLDRLDHARIPHLYCQQPGFGHVDIAYLIKRHF